MIHLSFAAYNNRGLTYADQDKFQRAIADYDEAIRLNPTYVRAYVNRGIAYVGLREADQALSDFRAATGLDPQSATAHALGAVVYMLMGNIPEADRELETAVALGFDLQNLVTMMRDVIEKS